MGLERVNLSRCGCDVICSHDKVNPTTAKLEELQDPCAEVTLDEGFENGVSLLPCLSRDGFGSAT